MPILGAHMSISGGFHKAIEAAQQLEMDCVQLFTASPQNWSVTGVPAEALAAPAQPQSKARSKKAVAQPVEPAWRSKELLEADIHLFRTTLAGTGIAHTLSHDSYLINLASPDDFLWRRSIAAFGVELLRAERLGIPYVVTHPGAFTTSDEETGLKRIIAALDLVHEQVGKLNVMALLENTAGQGSCLGNRFEHLGEIIAGVRQSERIGVCIDTCHAFAAGYPLAERKDYLATFKALDRAVGLDRVHAFHLNDSKKPLGARVDRHEHIGQGQIGLDAFRHLLNDRRFRKIPMYLETEKGISGDGEAFDAINLRTLRGLID